MAEKHEDSGRQRRSILSNGTWSAAQGGLTMTANSVVAFLLVLFVPVEDFGIYSYATALVAIAMSVMTAGLQGLAVKALLNDPSRNNSLITSLLLIREVLALLSYLLIVLISLTSGEFQTVAATLVAGAVLFARAADAPELWYRAQMRNKTPALIRIIVTSITFGIRIMALWLWPSIWVFLGLFVLEGVLAGCWLMVRYLRDRSAPGVARPSVKASLSLLRQSVPLTISGMANQINLRGDIVVIQALMGSVSVGVYAVAARLAELAYFLPVVFMNASLPVLLKIRSEQGKSSPAYRNFLQRSYDQAFWYGVLVAAIAGVGGSLIITFFLGPEYQQARAILWINVFACPFVFMAAVFSKWIIAEGVLWVSVVRHGVGAAANIGFNILLIPIWGLTGSATATLSSYIIASYLTCFIGRKTRLPAIQMTLAMVAPFRFILGRLAAFRSKEEN